MGTQSYIHGAIYAHDRTGERVILEGFRIRSIVVSGETDGQYRDIFPGDFSAEFSDTGEHNHEDYCCDVHHTHTVPHRGCILR